MTRIALGLTMTILAVGLISASASAEEPRGCDKFTWPVDRERAALSAAEMPLAATGSHQSVSSKAFQLSLKPLAEITLPKAPERASRQAPSFAGFASFEAPARKGLYQVVLSSAAWIDLIQDDGYLKPAAFSGALDCAGVRKLVRFDLGASPFVLQVSGASADKIGVLVEPVSAAQN